MDRPDRSANREPRGSWSNDVILFSSDTGRRGLDRVAAGGGAVARVTALDRSVGERVHGWPEFLPDGRHYIFRVKSDQSAHTGVYAGSLDSAERTRILSDDTNAVFVEPGYLLFRRSGVLVAQRFDTATLALTGEPIRLADGVQYSRVNGRGVFSASREGVLAYRTSVETTLVWFDRTGHRLRTIGAPSTYMDPEISPDETRVAVVRLDPQIGTPDVWLLDLADGTARRFTFEPASDVQPLWSPDGREIVFASDREGFFDLYRKAIDGSRSEAVLFKSSNHKFPLDWSRDGRYIVYSQTVTESSPAGLWSLPLAGGSPVGGRWPRTETRQARISPDGRWLAYVLGGADNELYVRPFGSDARGVPIASGGIEPQWRSDGTELFYIGPDQKLMSVSVTLQPTFRAGAARALFETAASSFASNVTGRNQYAVSADGQRFLFNVPAASSAPITVVVDWRTAVAPTR